MGQTKKPYAGASRPRFASAQEEAAFKNARNYGGADYRPPAAQAAAHQHFGTLLVSCERADLRAMPNGVMIYQNGAARLDALPPPAVPRAEVIDELYGAVVHGEAPLHDGAWAMATLEVCSRSCARRAKAATSRSSIRLPCHEARHRRPRRSILRHWREAVPNDRLAHLVKDATRALVRALQMRLAEHGVSFGHWTFLRILWEGDGLTQRELSEQAGVMEPTTFSALKAMERLGYIRRRRRDGDRKKVYVLLTPKGRALRDRLVPLAEDVNRIAVRGVQSGGHRGNPRRAAGDHREHGAGRTGRRHAHALDPRTGTAESRRAKAAAAQRARLIAGVRPSFFGLRKSRKLRVFRPNRGNTRQLGKGRRQ